MSESSHVVAIIPARGGSKRIPRKNIKLLAGKPLIEYTIRAALGSKELDGVYVSTEDEEIARVAKDCGAQVIERPTALATDSSSTEDALISAVEAIEKEEHMVSHVVLLQATSPLRGTDTIDQAIKIAMDSDADSVVSVCPIPNYYLSGRFEGDEYIPEYDSRPFSQTMPGKYRENGAVFVTKRELLLENKNRIGGKIRAVVMNELDSIDIDNIEDFELVERIMVGEYYE